MTREETKTILATIASVYPPNLLPPESTFLVNVWYQLLQDIEFKLASAAVAAWMQTNKYPPTIADIRDRIFTAAASDQLTPEQAWNKVMMAIRHFGNTEREDAEHWLGELWPLVADWRYYCTLPEDQQPNEKARFIRAYTALQSRHKEQAQISAPFTKLLEGSKLMIGDGHD